MVSMEMIAGKLPVQGSLTHLSEGMVLRATSMLLYRITIPVSAMVADG